MDAHGCPDQGPRGAAGAWAELQAKPPVMGGPAFSRSASMCSSQTLASLENTCSGLSQRAGGPDGGQAMADDAFYASPADCAPGLAPRAAPGGWLEPAEQGGPASATYAACTEMIRQHKAAEAPVAAELASLAGSGQLDEGSRLIVVSWMVEVAEEFGLQQETLHAAVALLDRFLATSNGVPRCVLQLVAVGCIFVASKQLEVVHPSVAQMVAVAAHSFSAGDLLRVERILLDGLAFAVTTPTPYAFLHLLTQATLAANVASGAGVGPSTEAVVSLAMYVTELALLDTAALTHRGSELATAALLLAHATLSRTCDAWPGVLCAAGLTAEALSPALGALQRLHAAAAAPASAQLAELLAPLKAKFGQDCWCRVASEVVPLALQTQAGAGPQPARA
ncbi:CCNA2 [Scenedesmus sp. PABB004]|nr:CCNA2 [Scenedesmus sp. PABB004]